MPGESVVGIEVPNTNPKPVTVKSVMDVEAYKSAHPKMGLPVPLGLDSGGEPAIADLTRMPHVLVAGATGAGKSVCMNALIVGLLMNRTPEQVRMVMIDPKRVELTPYAGIPHLYTEPVVEPDRAIVILRSLVQEMMERFRILESAGVRNISAFNAKSSVKMPYLLILVDELADLMLTGANDVERLLVRLAQLGRATGVHLVVATQRPSVDVVHRADQGQLPKPDQLLCNVTDRLPDHSRQPRRRETSWQGRHAVPAGRSGKAGASAGGLSGRRRGRGRGQLLAEREPPQGNAHVGGQLRRRGRRRWVRNGVRRRRRLTVRQRRVAGEDTTHPVHVPVAAQASDRLPPGGATHG